MQNGHPQSGLQERPYCNERRTSESSESEGEQSDSFVVVEVNKDGEAFIETRKDRKLKSTRLDKKKSVAPNVNVDRVVNVDHADVVSVSRDESKVDKNETIEEKVEENEKKIVEIEEIKKRFVEIEENGKKIIKCIEIRGNEEKIIKIIEIQEVEGKPKAIEEVEEKIKEIEEVEEKTKEIEEVETKIVEIEENKKKFVEIEILGNDGKIKLEIIELQEVQGKPKAIEEVEEKTKEIEEVETKIVEIEENGKKILKMIEIRGNEEKTIQIIEIQEVQGKPKAIEEVEEKIKEIEEYEEKIKEIQEVEEKVKEISEYEEKLKRDELQKKEDQDNVDALLTLSGEQGYPTELSNLIGPINEFKDQEFSEDRPLVESNEIRGKFATSGITVGMGAKRTSVDKIKDFLYNSLINSHRSLESTALMYACVNGHEEIVKMLLKAGSKQKVTEYQAGSALAEAARGGHIAVAKILLKHGATVYQHYPTMHAIQEYLPNHYHRTQYYSPLSLACLNDRMEMLRFLIEAGEEEANKSGQTEDYKACLHLACAQDNLEMAKYILKLGTDPNFNDRFTGETPYTLAAGTGNLDMIKLLLRHGARANYSDNTPLMAAVSFELTGVVNFLLAQGDNDVNAVYAGRTAFLMACENGNIIIADNLLKAGANMFVGRPLILATRKGHLHVVRYLIHLGLDVNEVNESGWGFDGYSALTHAADLGHRKIAEILISAGADLEHPCDRLETPLMKASREGHLSLMQYFINQGAEFKTALSYNGHTCLAIASLNNKPEAVDLLIRNGADIHYKMPNRSSVLSMRQINRLYDVMDVFDRHMGSKVVKKEVPEPISRTLSMFRDNSTPRKTQMMHLHRKMINAFELACARGNYRLLPIFLYRGARLELNDEKGLTPLVVAALAGQETVVRTILSTLGSFSKMRKKVNIFVMDRVLMGLTPICAAAFSGHVGIIKLLFELRAVKETTEEKGLFDFTPLMLAAANGHVETVKYLIEHGAADVNVMLKRKLVYE